MKLDAVKQLILSSNMKYAKILDAHGKSKIAVFAASVGQKEPTPNDICRKLDEFFTQFPGIYTLHVKRSSTSSNQEIFEYRNVESPALGEMQQTGITHIAQPVEQVDLKAMKELIKSELRAEQALKDKEREQLEIINEHKRKSKELDSAAGKMMYLGEKILTHILAKHPQLIGMLQGAPQEQIQGTNETMSENTLPLSDLSKMSEEETKTANVAMTILLGQMHPDLLLRFAEKIKSNPAILPNLISFLNN